MQLVDILMIK